MKTNQLFVLLAFITLLAPRTYGQQTEPALARVLYDFTHINDTLQPDKPHKEEMVLYIGKHASLYGTYTLERMNQLIKKQMDDPAFDGNLTITRSAHITNESYYARPADRIFKQVNRLAGDSYILEVAYPTIDWQLTDKTKTIGGYKVQQATGHFKGRDYTAWFTTELPFQSGPWKLLGLPGLVLEVADSRNEVAFRYAGFETLTKGDATVALPESAITATQKEFDRLTDAFNKNRQAFMDARAQDRAQHSGSATPLNGKPVMDPSRIKSINVVKGDSQTSATTNNPLELEGQKVIKSRKSAAGGGTSVMGNHR